MGSYLLDTITHLLLVLGALDTLMEMHYTLGSITKAFMETPLMIICHLHFHSLYSKAPSSLKPSKSISFWRANIVLSQH